MRKSDLLYRLLTGFCFTKQFNCTDNKDEVNRFFSLTFSVSLRLWCLTVVTSTNIVSRLALFQLHRTLKCPQSRHWISAPGWLFMLMTSTSVSHVEEDKKKEYFPARSSTSSLNCTTLHPFILELYLLATVQIIKI